MNGARLLIGAAREQERHHFRPVRYQNGKMQRRAVCVIAIGEVGTVIQQQLDDLQAAASRPLGLFGTTYTRQICFRLVYDSSIFDKSTDVGGNMHVYRDQVLASTSLDSQGERLTKAQLQKILELTGEKFLLHMHHDMEQSPRGHIENLRIECLPNVADEWALVGDVIVYAGPLEEALGGFSVSFTESLHEVDNPKLAAYLPFPYYNDTSLIAGLAVDEDLRIGKWIKKSADSVSSAIFYALLGFSFTQPVWDDFYKKNISPLVARFVRNSFPLLSERKVRLEHVQLVHDGDRTVEIRFIPDHERAEACFAETLLLRGLDLARLKLIESHAAGRRVTRIILAYDFIGREYYISRIEFAFD